MSAIQTVLLDPFVLIAIALVVAGFLAALIKRPRDTDSRKKFVYLLWAVCFAVVAFWAIRQESLVLAGSMSPSSNQPVAVATKGVTRYVSQDQAYRHGASMWVLLAALTSFMVIHKLAARANEA